MKVLALEHDRPGATGADFAPHLEDEARAVWSMLQDGSIREIYFREERSEAVIILEAARRRRRPGIARSIAPGAARAD